MTTKDDETAPSGSGEGPLYPGMEGALSKEEASDENTNNGENADGKRNLDASGSLLEGHTTGESSSKKARFEGKDSKEEEEEEENVATVDTTISTYLNVDSTAELSKSFEENTDNPPEQEGIPSENHQDKAGMQKDEEKKASETKDDSMLKSEQVNARQQQAMFEAMNDEENAFKMSSVANAKNKVDASATQEGEVDAKKESDCSATVHRDGGSAPEQSRAHEARTSSASNSVPTPTNQSGENQKRSKKNKHKDPRMLDIRRRIQMSCRDNDLETAVKAYEEAIAENVELEAQSYYNLLNLCDGLGKSVVHVGTPKTAASPVSSAKQGEGNDDDTDINNDSGENEGTSSNKEEAKPPFFMDLKKRLEYAFEIKERMSQLNLPLNETAYSAIIKLLSKNKEFERAEQMLDESESVQQCKPKLRLYSSLLTAYCEDTQMLKALTIWKRLKGKSGLALTERELLALLRCATATGDSLVMEFVLTELAEEVPVPSKDTVAAILEWFGITHSQHEESLTDRVADAVTVKQLLEDIANCVSPERPPSMGPVVSTDGWHISSACRIDNDTGKLLEGCLESCKLQPVHLSDRAVKDMVGMNESIVFDGTVAGNTCEFQGGRKGKKRNDFSPESRRHDWNNYVRFLERKEKQADSGSPFDVVIDGANIGYYQQNFSDAPTHVDYNQIDWVVRHFQKEKKQRVLLIMHSRHFTTKMLPQQYKSLYESWMKDEILYKTPFGMNDDWFWMHAALRYNLLVVTNDEMRDHHFQMLAPRYFLRWKERQRIRFSFGDWESVSLDNSEGRRRQRQVILEYPAMYSRRIQKVEDGLVVPLAKRGDENRFMDGSHFASEDEPKEETYLCIRPKAPVCKTDATNNLKAL
ncbi:PPR: pentatricopeptide repeat domain containing protein [Nitzschia inconspicua]|uniref:PPR: pentatricopeptide repeat domain containing protein n=1 Tax=Nitzschia inconspicua TaxID=303405 RepID=A0A9K3KI52_9STRA|nr:PPR: pentatricopeptide repeat domain containing protein [Nitzschia inconspicua]KAG7343836.1 PPR: pentatricopeptide repeat domain containing protein [Nitzschia inconspicua]